MARALPPRDHSSTTDTRLGAETFHTHYTAPHTMSEAEDALIKKVRDACLKRGVSGIKTIGRTFRLCDDNGNKQLSLDELKYGFQDYGLTLKDDEIQEIFRIFDKDGSGGISFDEFLVRLRPPMSKNRVDLIKKAFAKMDVTGDGVVTVEDVQKVYDVSQHEKYKSGEWTKKQCFQEFLKTFDVGERDNVVTFEEFLNYYSGVSASIDGDPYFDLMMRRAWKL